MSVSIIGKYTNFGGTSMCGGMFRSGTTMQAAVETNRRR
jgi:hypothetical protein